MDLFFSPIQLHSQTRSKADCQPNQVKFWDDKPCRHSKKSFKGSQERFKVQTQPEPHCLTT